MTNNTSRFLQLDSTILLEYIINNNNVITDDISSNVYDMSKFNPTIYEINIDNNKKEKLYVQQNDVYNTNNSLEHLAVPINKVDGTWFIPDANNINSIKRYCNDKSDIISKNITLTDIPFDKIKLHIINGYSFKDIYGILIQVKVKNNSNEYTHLANWLYRRSDTKYTYERAIILDNKIYDKYLELQIPSYKFLSSISNLSDDNLTFLGENGLDIANSKNTNNIEIIYSIITSDSVRNVYDENNLHIGYSFLLDNQIKVDIPYDSEADRFNAYIAESSNGNYLDFYATWDNKPITKNVINSFNTRIKLYSSNNYNSDAYYEDMNNEVNNMWIINHEIISYFYKDGKYVIMPQHYNIQQTFNIDNVNNQTVFNFKPIITNNIDANNIDYITIEYTVRLINRYDGFQIVRKAALTTYNIERYIENLLKLNTDNIYKYNVYNKIVNKTTELQNTNIVNTKFIKVYYNASEITLDNINTTNINDYVQPISKFGGTYLFTFKNNDNSFVNFIDFTSYVLTFIDNNNNLVEINSTYSNNMNMNNGQLEFFISPTNALKMQNVNDKKFAIVSKNIDGSSSIIAEIKYKI